MRSSYLAKPPSQRFYAQSVDIPSPSRPARKLPKQMLPEAQYADDN